MQVLENAMAVVPADDDMDLPLIMNHPINITSVPQVGAKRAPNLGEHGKEVLGELGYDEGEIAALQERGVI